MKVKTSAFALDFHGVNIFEFLRYLRDDAVYIRQNRVLILDELQNVENMWGGYLLNLREERTTPQVKLTEEELEVVFHEITDEDLRHAEFNFFIINTNTRKGLFQTYSRAARWTYFAHYLGHRFNKFMSDTNRRDVWFVPSPIFRQETFEAHLQEFEWIKEIKIEASRYDIPESSFRKLKEQAQRRVEIFKFYKRHKWNLRTIKESLITIFSEEKAEDLRIEGTVAGVESVYTLANNVEVFYEEEYEEWIRNLTFTDKTRSNSVNTSQTIVELLRIYNETLLLTRLDKRDPPV
jgi:hypothetical protein